MTSMHYQKNSFADDKVVQNVDFHGLQLSFSEEVGNQHHVSTYICYAPMVGNTYTIVIRLCVLVCSASFHFFPMI